MNRLQTSILFSALLFLASFAPAAPAQSGPITGTGYPAQNTGQAPQQRVQFTNQTLPNLFQQMGYNVQTLTLANGNPYWVLTTQQNGWNFRVEVKAYYLNGNINGYWMSSDLGRPVGAANGLSQDALLKLLEANNRICPYFFAYNAQSGHVCLKLEYPYNGATQQQLQQSANDYLAKVRDTYSLWQNLHGGNAGGGLSGLVPGKTGAPAANPSLYVN